MCRQRTPRHNAYDSRPVSGLTSGFSLVWLKTLAAPSHARGTVADAVIVSFTVAGAALALSDDLSLAPASRFITPSTLDWRIPAIGGVRLRPT